MDYAQKEFLKMLKKRTEDYKNKEYWENNSINGFKYRILIGQGKVFLEKSITERQF